MIGVRHVSITCYPEDITPSTYAVMILALESKAYAKLF